MAADNDSHKCCFWPDQYSAQPGPDVMRDALQGELKRKLDRMIKRFLAKHQVVEEERMSFTVALTVMRIQRHWRAVTARRAAERARAESRAAERRAAGLPSVEEQPAAEAAAAAGLDAGAAVPPLSLLVAEGPQLPLR
jgi:hypothetical protein